MSPHFISSEIGVLSSTEEGVSLFVTLGVLFRTYAGFCNCMGLLRNRMMRKEGIKKEFVLHVSFDTSQFFSARCIRERAYAFCSAFIAREEKEREKTQVVEAMKAEALKEKEEHEQAIVALKSRQEERSVCDGCVRCSDEKEERAGHTERDAASAPSEDGRGGGGVEGASQSAEGEEREGRGADAATV